jgi:sortase A
MPDHRIAGELSIKELEVAIAIRKRERRVATRLNGSNRPRKSPARTWRDRCLLLIEVAALFGLVLVVINSEQSRAATNQAVTDAQVAPAMLPVPLIGAVVLPDGHKPPTAPGGAAPNFDEVPSHLRAYVQSITPVPISTPAQAQATRIQIPALNIDAMVLHGTDWEQLKLGVGHNVNSANPGERGNLVLAAHNDVYGELFRYLDRLKPGDEVVVYANQQRYRYMITGSRIVEPTQVEVMAPTSTPTVTLISCYPYLVDTKRIAVFAELQS